jgi:hypothetical protein
MGIVPPPPPQPVNTRGADIRNANAQKPYIVFFIVV